MQRIIKDCHSEAMRLLIMHRRELDALAAVLERETLDEKDTIAVTALRSAEELEAMRPFQAVKGFETSSAANR